MRLLHKSFHARYTPGDERAPNIFSPVISFEISRKPTIFQKTYGFLMILREIEVIRLKQKLTIRSKIWRRSI